MQVLAGGLWSCDRLTYGLRVAVHLGGVDMPVAEPQRALDRGAAGIALHAKGAEPELGQADALGLQMFHLILLKMSKPPLAQRKPRERVFPLRCQPALH